MLETVSKVDREGIRAYSKTKAKSGVEEVGLLEVRKDLLEAHLINWTEAFDRAMETRGAGETRHRLIASSAAIDAFELATINSRFCKFPIEFDASLSIRPGRHGRRTSDCVLWDLSSTTIGACTRCQK